MGRHPATPPCFADLSKVTWGFGAASRPNKNSLFRHEKVEESSGGDTPELSFKGSAFKLKKAEY